MNENKLDFYNLQTIQIYCVDGLKNISTPLHVGCHTLAGETRNRPLDERKKLKYYDDEEKDAKITNEDDNQMRGRGKDKLCKRNKQKKYLHEVDDKYQEEGGRG